MAKLQDLIAKCDETEIMTQSVIDNLAGAEIKGKNGTITFATDPALVKSIVLGKPEKLPYVI